MCVCARACVSVLCVRPCSKFHSPLRGLALDSCSISMGPREAAAARASSRDARDIGLGRFGTLPWGLLLPVPGDLPAALPGTAREPSSPDTALLLLRNL